MTKKKSTKKKAPIKTAVKKSVAKKPRKPRARPIQREVAVKKYVVRLSSAERERLEEMIGKGKGSAGHLLKARILLKADVSEAGNAWSDSRIIEALDTTPSTVYGTRQQLVEEGFDAVFLRKKRETPPVPRIFDGEKEARLIAVTCSTPPAGYARWSLRLLENKVVELGIVDAASDSTIGRVLKKTFSSRIVRNSG
jgi:Homeodomain-like domain